MREELIETLRKQAAEIAAAGHSGWGNTMLCAADALAAQCGDTPSGLAAMQPVAWRFFIEDDAMLKPHWTAWSTSTEFLELMKKRGFSRIEYAAPPSQPVALPPDLAEALAELHAALGTPATQGGIGDSPYLGVVKLAAKRLAEKPVALPDGWVAVPREPTQAMMEAGYRDYGSFEYMPRLAVVQGWGDRAVSIYRAMIAAAPAGEGVPK